MSDPVAANSVPMSGAIPIGARPASVLRIPVPGTAGLAVELRPKGWVQKGGSTSTVFIQDLDGKHHLRLDCGFNVKTQSIDYCWNKKETNANFGITDHGPACKLGPAFYKGAKYFKYAERVLVVDGVALDVISIVQASKSLRRTTQVVTAWTFAGLGWRTVGAGGAPRSGLLSNRVAAPLLSAR